MRDMRVEAKSELRPLLDAMLATVTSPRVGVYPVLIGETMVTAVGYQRADDEIVPVAIILSEQGWADVPHLTQEYGPTKDWT